MNKREFSAFNTELLEPVVPLLQKLLAGEILSAGELLVLEQWKNLSADNTVLYEKLQEPVQVQAMLQQWHAIERNREVNKARGMRMISDQSGNTAEPARVIRFWQRKAFRYAAAIIVLLGVGTYFRVTNNKKDQTLASNNKPATTVIAPGRNGAVLTLADGSQVVLDSLNNGVVAAQNGATVVLQNGQLSYDQTGATGAIAYNTISTPKGRQFRLVLPDGSKVWLNAASTVKYPTVFTGKERRVQLDGEAYFEVAKNVSMPFRISIGNETEVEVLGTSFNINSYKNEHAIRTTLIEGAVKLNAYDQQQTLKPGQQAVVTPSREMKVIGNVDVDKVMAWKNGLFNFDDATLEEVMRELERWYDIEVTYTKGIPATRFGGEINKQNTLQDVLQILEKSNVHFRLEEGRKLVVIP